MTAHIEVRLHRVGWCLLAAVLALVSCGHTHAAPSPTIEYRTPEVPHVGVDDRGLATVVVRDIPLPPSCTVGCKPPTQTPTATPTPIPIATAAPPTEAPSAQQVATVRPVAGAAYAGQCGGGYEATVTRWWPVITQYAWDACTALHVINAESDGLNVYNYQGSGACGVMQLLPCQYPNDGAANIAAGYQKYVAAGGWSPWEVIGK